jgi:hypothetical protein
MALSDMKVYSREIQSSVLETIPQMLDAFNAASNGAIQMSMDGFEGDFIKNAIYSSFESSRYRVDRYAANGAKASTALAQIEGVGVKVAGAYKMNFEPAQMTWLLKNPAEGIEVISRGVSEGIFQDMLNSGISSAAAAFANNAGVTNDITAGVSATVTQAELNNTYAKFGDASQQIVANVMNGIVYHQLIGEALANSAQLFTAGNVRVIDIQGKRSIITDAPALTNATTDYRVLGLTTGGIVINNGSDVVQTLGEDLTKDRAEMISHTDYTFGVNVKGYAWDVTNGGKSPTDAELATGTNWDKYVSNDKHTGGVVLIADQS